MLRDFDLTLSYFDAGIDAVQFARTISHQERANQEMRRKFNSMCVVQSDAGERAAVHLAVLAYNHYASGDDWTDIIRALCSSSLAKTPINDTKPCSSPESGFLHHHRRMCASQAI